MEQTQCLVCCEDSPGLPYHPKCARELFGTPTPAEVNLSPQDIEILAGNLVQNHVTIPGVQRKISLELGSPQSQQRRLTLVGVLGGSHILKPASPDYPELPALEHLTMRLARLAGIKTAANGLVPLRNGSLAYLVRRFDRWGAGKKLAVEDLCQLCELPAEGKYRFSCEGAGKVIRKFSHNPGDDALRFFEIVFFSFLVGNSDMHLKNYSLIEQKNGVVGLSPAYDLLATQILTEDSEESALTINGKRAKLKRVDFVALGSSLRIPEKVVESCMKRQLGKWDAWRELIGKSFLSPNTKVLFESLIGERRMRVATQPYSAYS
jgi:serine/threonine-protein kinase HipA